MNIERKMLIIIIPTKEIFSSISILRLKCNFQNERRRKVNSLKDIVWMCRWSKR